MWSVSKMKNILLLGSLLFFTFETNAACTTNGAENPIFTLTNNLGSFKTNTNSQPITATVSPDRYGTIINNCNGDGSVNFKISTTDISTSGSIPLNGRTYFRITKAQTPSATSAAQIYIAFSVKDNQTAAPLFQVNSDSPYTLYTGTSDTRGMRLEQVSLLIRGTNLTPGTYNLNNVVLGTYTATDKNSTATRNITISGLNYTVSASTCTVNSSNITLPSMRSSDFSSTNRIGATTSFSITANCPNDAVNTSYSATITDNFTSSINSEGLLSNSISVASGGSNIQIRLTDSSNNPISIGPLSLNNKFTFGTLNTLKSVSKSLNASYYAPILPVSAGLVTSVGVINLIYD